MHARLALLLCLPLPAGATTPIAEFLCAPRADLVERLTRSHQAQLVGSGIRDVDSVMEVWADPDGDWMLVQSHADGSACLVAMGEAWDMPVSTKG